MSARLAVWHTHAAGKQAYAIDHRVSGYKLGWEPYEGYIWRSKPGDVFTRTCYYSSSRNTCLYL